MKDHWMAYMAISFMTCISMHKMMEGWIDADDLEMELGVHD